MLRKLAMGQKYGTPAARTGIACRVRDNGIGSGQRTKRAMAAVISPERDVL